MSSFWSTLEPRDERIKRILRETPPDSIDAAVDGREIKVVGSAFTVMEPLIAPFSGDPCLGWEVIIETYAEDPSRPGGGILSIGWYEVFRRHELLPFSIDDRTGVAYVEDQFLELTLVKDATFYLDDEEGLREELIDFVERYEVGASTRIQSFAKLRITVGFLESGEVVGALGSGRWEVDSSGTARQGGYRSPAKRLVIEANEDEDLLVSDDPAVLD